MKKFENMTIPGDKWFMVLGIKTIVLTVLYISLHFIGNYNYGDILDPQNTKLEYLSGDQILVVTEFNKTEIILTDSILLNKKLLFSKDSLVRQNIFKYICNLYPDIDLSETKKLKEFITVMDLNNIKPLLSKYPIRIHSLFWLGNKWIYLELTFWALFGVLANLLYNVAEQIRNKSFTKYEIPVHVAKILYSPFCVIIIYICYNTINEQPHDIQYTLYSLAVAFLLGFFSGRMIDLLNRIKDLLLPLGKSSTDNTTGATATETEIENLPVAGTEIIEEAMSEKGEEWINSFPNVTGFSIRNKIIEGTESKDIALIFKVNKKEAELEFGKIPKLISFTAKDGKKYKIITDVLEEPIPTPNVVAINKSPFPLGTSVSREHSGSTGSVGLIVKKPGDEESKYIISCYHVLCAPELKMQNKTFTNNNNTATIRCASFADNGTNNIGYTIEGKLDSVSDFAVAKLNDGYIINNTIFDWNITPRGLSRVLESDKGKTIKMTGRTSGKKTGKIKSQKAAQLITYTGASQYFSKLIEIDPISQGGDSGTAVIDENDCVIGLIIAGNKFSSYVLPLNEFMNTNKYFI